MQVLFTGAWATFFDAHAHSNADLLTVAEHVNPEFRANLAPPTSRPLQFMLHDGLNASETSTKLRLCHTHGRRCAQPRASPFCSRPPLLVAAAGQVRMTRAGRTSLKILTGQLLHIFLSALPWEPHQLIMRNKSILLK